MNQLYGRSNKGFDELSAFAAEMKAMSDAHNAGDIDAVMPEEKFEGIYRTMAKGVNDMVNGHITVKKKAMACVAEFTKGNYDAVLEKFPGKKAFINETIEPLRVAVKALIADANVLSQAAVEGKLATRADATKHQGDYRKIVQGVNDTLDAVIGPLNVAAKYVDQISKGDIPAKITDTYKGDFNEIKNNLNMCVDAVNALVAEAKGLPEAAVAGKLATRADAAKHQGDYRKVVQGVNDTLDAVIGPLNVTAKYVDQISKGDIPPKITDAYKGDFNEVKNNLNMCIDAINALVAEAKGLSEAAVAGKLATRADAAKHQGDYRKIVQGVNDTLDAILIPVGESNRILVQISNGKTDELVAQNYKGDHEKTKQAVNNIAVALQNLQKEMLRMSDLAKEGQLSERAKPDLFKGSYAEIVKGVNTTLDAIVIPVVESTRIVTQVSEGKVDELVTQALKGDHEKLKNGVNNIAVAVQLMQKEMLRMSDLAKEGQLSERAKPDQFQGAYAEIVKGVNTTLDAILVPTVESNRILFQIAKGKIDELVAQNYKGDHEKTKQAVNNIAVALQGMAGDVNVLVKAAVEGKLATRADASKHQGDYGKIVQGVNDCLDAVIGPLNVAAKYVDQISKGDIPAKITDTYKGDFNEIKNNLNMCVDAVNALVAEAKGLSEAAVEGKLATRADAAKHQGEYRKIVRVSTRLWMR